MRIADATLAVTLAIVKNMSMIKSMAIRTPIPSIGNPNDRYTGLMIRSPPLGIPGE